VRLLNDFAQGLDPVPLTYFDFVRWLNSRAREIDDLFGSGERTCSRNQRRAFSRASNLFLQFQAFLALFVRQNLETTRFHRLYRAFEESLRVCLSENNPDYGDISIVTNSRHEHAIRSTIKELQQELAERKFYRHGLMRPIELTQILTKTAGNEINAAQSTEGFHSDVGLLQCFEVVPVWTSTSGIGTGRNFIVKSST